MGLGAMTGVCLQGQTRRGSSAGSEDRTRGAGGRASLRAIGGGVGEEITVVANFEPPEPWENTPCAASPGVRPSATAALGD